MNQRMKMMVSVSIISVILESPPTRGYFDDHKAANQSK